MNPTYLLVKMTAGVLATIGLYSVLYRENKFYRFFEHAFLGLAGGYMIVALWTENLKDGWWDVMVGTAQTASEKGSDGHWLWAALLPIGLMGYLVFNKKHAWMSRIPIGVMLGLWSGQQVQVWFNRFGPQIADSMRPIWPSTWETMTRPNTEGMDPAAAAAIADKVYPSQALGNLIFIITLLSVISYFLFSFDIKNRAVKGFTVTGRWLLMIGFGAIFGSTVMMRFSLLIDRMYFVWVEWLQHTIMHR